MIAIVIPLRAARADLRQPILGGAGLPRPAVDPDRGIGPAVVGMGVLPAGLPAAGGRYDRRSRSIGCRP